MICSDCPNARHWQPQFLWESPSWRCCPPNEPLPSPTTSPPCSSPFRNSARIWHLGRGVATFISVPLGCTGPVGDRDRHAECHHPKTRPLDARKGRKSIVSRPERCHVCCQQGGDTQGSPPAPPVPLLPICWKAAACPHPSTVTLPRVTRSPVGWPRKQRAYLGQWGQGIWGPWHQANPPAGAGRCRPGSR